MTTLTFVPLDAPRRSSPSVIAGALLLACLYLPTLAARFDFIDDGNLVYPTPSRSAAERFAIFWDRVIDNYNHLGPFRPVVWVHWAVVADLAGADPVRWRLARLTWNAVSAGMLLWLLRELGARPGAALFAAALAMGSPYRSEIWTSLTLSEGVAMPYALGTLICAVRASRSRRPWRWDLAGVLCALAAIGCKNTFAALVPAQVVLRMLAGGQPWREAWRQHGLRAILLAAVLVFPAAHYVVFRLNWHPGQYTLGQPTWAQLGRMLKAVSGAASLAFVGAGVILAALAVGTNGWDGLRRHRVALLAAGMLLVAGVTVYVPLNAVSGRYSMPAVWGVDVVVALVLTELPVIPIGVWKRFAQAALVLGLLGVIVANVGRQDRIASRSEVLWRALEHVERAAGPGAVVEWRAGPRLDVEEGIHFAWHMQGRGRTDVGIRLFGTDGLPRQRPELEAPTAAASFLIADTPTPLAGWRLESAVVVPYWFGLRRHACYLYSPLASEVGAKGRGLAGGGVLRLRFENKQGVSGREGSARNPLGAGGLVPAKRKSCVRIAPPRAFSSGAPGPRADAWTPSNPHTPPVIGSRRSPRADSTRPTSP